MARLRRAAPYLLALAVAAAYLLWRPPTPDLAAAAYRAELGATLWDNGWYAGHHTLGYSVLVPPLAGALGIWLLGALAYVVASWSLVALLRRWVGARRARWPELWGVLALGTNLVIGRLAFGVGLALALAAAALLQYCCAAPRSRPPDSAHQSGAAARVGRVAGLSLALLASLASPVAGLAVVVGGAALVVTGPRRTMGAALVGVSVIPILLVAWLFPTGGEMPFAGTAFWSALVFAALAVLGVPREHRLLRLGIVVWLLGCLLAYAVDTPVGSTATRAGVLLGGPLALAAMTGHRRWGMTALVLLWCIPWQLAPMVGDLRRIDGDPSTRAAFYAPLLAFLDEHAAPGERVEVVPTRNHWEAHYVARRHPLARGWERQADIHYNSIFYAASGEGDHLAWLRDSAVRWVAYHPRAPLDPAGEREARRLILGPTHERLPRTTLASGWLVFRVPNPEPLVSPPGRFVAMDDDSLTVTTDQPGDLRVRLHWTRWWRVDGGACVSRDGEWTRIRVPAAGTYRLAAALSWRGLRSGSGADSCRENTGLRVIARATSTPTASASAPPTASSQKWLPVPTMTTQVSVR